MEASCGPTNALSSLSKHTQRDNSLQNEFIHKYSGNQPQRFRQGSQVDTRLNDEFQQFNEGNFIAPDFKQHHQQHHLRQQHHQNQQHQLQQHQNQHQRNQHQQNQHHQNQLQHNPAWVQDFSNLAIQQPKQEAPIQNDWHQLFMQQHLQPQINHQHQQQRQPLMNQHGTAFTMNNARGMQMNQIPHMTSEAPQMENSQTDFDSQFDLIEREMEGRMDDPTLDTEHDREKFAETARQVESSLRAAESRLLGMNDKLQNSNFLKLMSSISTRQVELQGDKLVNADSKQDIREEISQHLSDPLADIKNEMGTSVEDVPDHNYASLNYQIPNTTRPQNQSTAPHTSHLSDPLAHIKDGDLNSENMLLSLQAARIISGNQVKPNDWIEDDDWLDMTEDAPRIDAYKPRRNGLMSESWQEMYDDYRPDDDFR